MLRNLCLRPARRRQSRDVVPLLIFFCYHFSSVVVDGEFYGEEERDLAGDDDPAQQIADVEASSKPPKYLWYILGGFGATAIICCVGYFCTPSFDECARCACCFDDTAVETTAKAPRHDQWMVQNAGEVEGVRLFYPQALDSDKGRADYTESLALDQQGRWAGTVVLADASTDNPAAPPVRMPTEAVLIFGRDGRIVGQGEDERGQYRVRGSFRRHTDDAVVAFSATYDDVGYKVSFRGVCMGVMCTGNCYGKQYGTVMRGLPLLRGLDRRWPTKGSFSLGLVGRDAAPPGHAPPRSRSGSRPLAGRARSSDREHHHHRARTAGGGGSVTASPAHHSHHHHFSGSDSLGGGRQHQSRGRSGGSPVSSPGGDLEMPARAHAAAVAELEAGGGGSGGGGGSKRGRREGRDGSAGGSEAHHRRGRTGWSSQGGAGGSAGASQGSGSFFSRMFGGGGYKGLGD